MSIKRDLPVLQVKRRELEENECKIAENKSSRGSYPLCVS